MTWPRSRKKQVARSERPNAFSRKHGLSCMPSFMKPNDAEPKSAVPKDAQLDDFVAAYEAAQTETGQADLAAFLPASDHPLYAAVLRELIRVDQEYAWQQGHPKRLEV